MEKRDFFAKLLKRDFIKCVLLRKPKFSQDEINARLDACFEGVDPYTRMKGAITEVFERRASIELLTVNGRTVQKLPDWLNPELAEIIADDFTKEIQQLCPPQIYVDRIIDQIERLAWCQGVDDMAVNITNYTYHLAKKAAQYRNIPLIPSDNYYLQAKYLLARRRTLSERVRKTNDQDILAFRGALLDYCTSLCETILYRRLANLYTEIATDSRIAELVTRFSAAHAAADNILASLNPSEGASAPWLEEYARRVPLAFFETNIEDVDSAMVFQIMLLQAIARNEQAMRDRGYLTPDGKMRLFTAPGRDGLRWVDTDFAFIID